MACKADATIFELHGPEGTERAVDATNDGHWVFGAHGAPQPFERPERYAERRIRDRFTPQMLGAYLAALGIRAFDEGFYMPDGEAGWSRRTSRCIPASGRGRSTRSRPAFPGGGDGGARGLTGRYPRRS